MDDSIKSRVRFTVQEWDNIPALLTSTDWTQSGRILLFEFWNAPGSLQLKLMIGPGSGEVRQKLFDMARGNSNVLVPSKTEGRHSRIFIRQFLDRGMYEDTAESERERELRKRWVEFVEEDLPQIDTVLKKEQWIWQHLSDADKMA